MIETNSIMIDVMEFRGYDDSIDGRSAMRPFGDRIKRCCERCLARESGRLLVHSSASMWVGADEARRIGLGNRVLATQSEWNKRWR
jgi:hypothetical protein